MCVKMKKKTKRKKKVTDKKEINIEPLYEDASIVLCEKPPIILTLPSEKSEKSLIDYLSDYYAKTGEAQTLYPVHRLDRGTGGLVVFAKTKKAAAELSSVFAEHRNTKEYLAVLDGRPQQTRAELCDILYADKKANKAFVVSRERKGAKEARLFYEILKTKETEKGEISLARIELKTGRMHQIRAQLSHIGNPLTGDGKYGSRNNSCQFALYAFHLKFSLGKKEYEFFSYPDVNMYPYSLFAEEINALR
ncbi:MAG: RluA family pseudouridine synthase [Ruminococcaceae bacterium]|nr:RluA family pseudouridine synthase [Oscillospiraceae bacterium]